jgi:hypothetical protein
MNLRSKRLAVVVSLVALALGGTFSAVALARGWHSVGKENASGDYAIAIASGNANHPSKLAVKVTSSPDQEVTGNWIVICSRGTGAGTKEGEFSGETPLVKHMRMPYASPSSCTVSASAMLEGGGKVSVNLLAR